LTFERPERLNAFDEALWKELGRRLDDARRTDPRALVIAGSHSCFSAGMDLAAENPIIARLATCPAGTEGDTARAILGELREIMRRLWEFPAPTIAAVEGPCIGGGLEIAVGCDIRVAGARAEVRLPEVAFGVVPDLGGMTRLCRLVGPGRAAFVALSGRTMSAAEAEHLRIFECVVEAGQALEEATRLAFQIAGNAPGAVRSALAVLRRLPDLSMNQGLDAELAAGLAALSGSEMREGLRALAEKRPPSWSASIS
jgi:enoyl-CoA hydratase/carnithine racemase